MTPTETVNAFIAAVERSDVAAAAELVADDVSYENVPIDPIVGREGLIRTLEGFLAPATAVEWRIIEQWEVDGTVINERLDRFQIGDGWLELPVAGVFKVDGDGRIALWRDYFDLSTYTRQMAALTDQG